MLFLIALIIAFSFAFLCKDSLKKHSNIFYISAVIVTVIISIADFRNLPTFVNNYIIALFSRGALATALWCVVMWAGAFPNGSKPIKTLMPIRGELSIFAAILTLGHNIGYGKTYFVRLFTDAGRMSTGQISASIMTIVMLLIMIPLTIMSFPSVRKKMNAKLWKKIQRTAYVFYALIYVHVMTLCVPMARTGREGYLLSIFMYSLVFISYGVFRIKKYMTVKKKTKNSTWLNALCAGIVALLLIPVTACSKADNTEKNNSEPVQTTVTTAVTTTEKREETTEATTIQETEETTEITTTEETTAEQTSEESAMETEEIIEDVAEEPAEENYEELIEEEIYEEPVEENYEEPVEEPIQEEIPEPEPEPEYIYNNGTYTATAYGYDGDVEVTITIENDVIVSIEGITYESDSWYFETASASVFDQILSSQNSSVDAVSGATFSSEAIMQAVQSALDSARR